MGFDKKQLEKECGIGRKALDDTLKALGIDHLKSYYSDEDFSEWIEPARKMITEEKKTLADVKKWAEEKRSGNANANAQTKRGDLNNGNPLDKVVEAVTPAMEDLVDAAVLKALEREVENPMGSIRRVLGKLSSQQIRGMMNSDNYHAELGNLMKRDQGSGAFGGQTPRNLLGESDIDEEEEEDEDLSEWDKPIDVEASDVSDGSKDGGGVEE
jgi:hypothetical protein